MRNFLSPIFSNPDLRRSELSLDAMLQRTSSNSSSSSSPSSQGGSAERRGTETQTHAPTLQQKLTYGHACIPNGYKFAACARSCYKTCKCGHGEKALKRSTCARSAAESFGGYQRVCVSRSSALINLSDVPCYPQPRGR